MDGELYNLLISGDENAWEQDTKIMDLDRCIREYTEKDIVERYSKLGRTEIEEIKKIPCVFAYEDYCKKDACLGYISNIRSKYNDILEFLVGQLL